MNIHTELDQHTNWDDRKLFSPKQKELFLMKVKSHPTLSALIQIFCEDEHCETEELYTIACTLYDVSMRSKNHDIHKIGMLHYLPKLEAKFGKRQGEFVFEKIIIPLQALIHTTLSRYAHYVEETAKQTVRVLR